MKPLLLFLFWIQAFNIVAQQTIQQPAKVACTILNEAKQPIEGATAELHQAKNGSLVRSSVTDQNGMAEFDRVPAGEYKIKVSMIHMQPTETDAFAVNGSSLVLPSVFLKPGEPAELKGVTVTARKPFIQKLSDRIV